MEIEGYLVYYVGPDNEAYGHEVYIDELEAIEYAIKLANEATDLGFTSFHQTIQWYENLDPARDEDPGLLEFKKIKIKSNLKDK